MAWRREWPGVGPWMLFTRRRRAAAAALAIVMAVTGLVACSARQEDPEGSPSTSSGTTPASPTEEPSQDATSPSAAPADAECLGRAVTIAGTTGPDRLVGTGRRDVFLALDGDDVITDVGEGDRVCTGDGDDRVVTIESWTDARVDLGTGHDTFRGSASRVSGGPGADRVRAGGVTRVEPGAGRDLVMARPTKDPYEAACVSYVGMARRIVANLARGWVRAQGRDRVRGVQCLYGTRFADRITGSARDDQLYVCGAWASRSDRSRNIVHAGAGDDLVHACSGGDLVRLGDGKDVFMGGDGDDKVYGEAGPDAIHGINGSDHLEGGDGNDRVNGTFYCDTASSAGDGMGDTSPNQVYGGNGDDEVTGDLAADLLDGGPGVDNGYGGRPGREGRDVIISVEQRTSCR